MKIYLTAFGGALEGEFDAPIKDERYPVYLIHRNIDHLRMFKEEDISKIPDPAFKKAKFEHSGKWTDTHLPVYEFKGLE